VEAITKEYNFMNFNFNKNKIIYGLIILLTLIVISRFIPFQPHFNDFGHLYASAYTLSLDPPGDPYYAPLLRYYAFNNLEIKRLNPYVYPPLTGYLFIPLLGFSFMQAGYIWYYINIFLLAAAVLIFIDSQKCNNRIFLFALAMAVLSTAHPAVRTLTAGQLNMLLLFLLAIAWWAYSRKMDWLCGAMLALGTMIKLFPGLLIVYFIWKKKWKVALWAIVIFQALLIYSVLFIADWEVHTSFYNNILKHMGYGKSTWAEFSKTFHIDIENQAPSAVWYRLLTWNKYTRGIIDSPMTAKIMSILTALAVFGISLFTSRKKTDHSDETEIIEYSIFLTAAMLIPSIMWDHYLILLLIPSIALGAYWYRHPEVLPWGWIVLGLCWGVINLNYTFFRYAYKLQKGFLTLLFDWQCFAVIAVWILCIITIRRSSKLIEKEITETNN